MRLKESSPGLGCLDAYVSDCEQTSHHLRLFHSDLFHGLDIADPIVKSIGDFNVLDVWDSIDGIVEMFHVVTKAFIMLLSDGLQSLSSRRTLVRALEVPNEHGTQLVDEPRSGHTGQGCRQIVSFYPIISSYGLDEYLIDLDELLWISRPIIFVNVPGLELIRPSDVPEWCRQSMETAPP
jgi:hypothetical protein